MLATRRESDGAAPAQETAGTSSQVIEALPTPAGPTIRERWVVHDKVGQGTFGHTYRALDLELGRAVALKIEDPQAKKPVLKTEMYILKLLQDSPYACRFVGCGRCEVVPKTLAKFPNKPAAAPANADDITGGGPGGARPPNGPTLIDPDTPIECNYLVMQLLGASLSELRRRMPKQKFSVATTALLGQQMLRGIQAMHELGFLHRDIKPSNFVMDLPDNELHATRGRCYIIDFGLARRYTKVDGSVREQRPMAGFRGTVRYASIRAHESRDLGRVDDLWSLLYVLVEFMRGELPWRKEKDKKKVGQLKKKLTTSKLVKDLPTPMTHFLAYLTTLGFESKPDYDYVHRLLEGMFSGSKQPKNVRYDWEMLDGEAVASDASQKEVVPVKFDASIVQKHMENVSIEENINGGMDATPATAKPTEAGPELRPRPPLITRGILRMFRSSRWRRPSMSASSSAEAAPIPPPPESAPPLPPAEASARIQATAAL